jgi:hypothetical protein
MKKTHVIYWKCTATGRVGTGTILFDREHAERLAAELNDSHPEIEHEAIVGTIPARDPNLESEPRTKKVNLYATTQRR